MARRTNRKKGSGGGFVLTLILVLLAINECLILNYIPPYYMILLLLFFAFYILIKGYKPALFYIIGWFSLFIFVFLSLISGRTSSLEHAAFLNLIFVLLAMPVVAFTGYTDWKIKYSGAMTGIFKTKIICAELLKGTLFNSLLYHFHYKR